MADQQGPGIIGTDDVGNHTVASTTLLTPRLIMAYGAAVEDSNPRYFDDVTYQPLIAHPCWAFSLQWNNRFYPDLPMNKRAAPFGVHATTDLRMYQPFSQGQAITIQGQCIHKEQIKPGVYSVERYSMRNGAGDLVAELDWGNIIRGATLDGDNKAVAELYNRPQVDQTDDVLWQKNRDISPYFAQVYTECSYIYNPIHTQRSVALAAGLPDIILHGSATKAIALSEICNQFFAGNVASITRLYGQLRGMVLMGTSISIVVHKQQHIEQDGKTVKQVFFSVRNEQGQLAIANGVVEGLESTE